MNTEEEMRAAGLQKPETEQTEEQARTMRELEARLHGLTREVAEMAQPQNPEIERRFTYHAPKGNQQVRYERIRNFAKNLAYVIEQACPDSREKSLALTNLEQAVMWANASIARNE